MDKKLKRIIQPGYHFYFAIFLLFALSCAYVSPVMSSVGIVLCLMMYLIYRQRERLRRTEMMRYLQGVTLDAGHSSRSSIVDFPLPTVIVRASTNEILWANDAFCEATGHWDCAPNENFRDIAPDFDTQWLADGESKYSGELKVDDNYFWVYGSIVNEQEEILLVLYFVPCTDYIHCRERYTLSRPIVSIICIDNYEELTKSATDSEKSSILAEIDRKIAQWAKDSRSLLRKYDRDKYIFVLESGDLSKLASKKFSVLDDVRTIQSRAGVVATLSIGIGSEGENFSECFHYAGVALDMALSRGGDQAVIKTKYNFEFFGGLSKELEKRTKVKSRVVANALMQLIRESSRVMIMGHQTSDMDSVGAAVGMACAVKTHGKPVNIVVRKEKSLAKELISKIENKEGNENLFIEPDDAMVLCDYNTLLIVVDTNRPDYVESLPLLQSINKVAVIDHHRRAASYIENFALNLHEPYASSASELVCELLQYMVQSSDVSKEEAECLLAGIYLDTKGFSIKTGVRTFEAAAYLKRAGAEMVAVKKLFQSTLEEYMQCQRVISSAKDCGGGIILAISDEDIQDRALAAIAADSLLNIIGVRASVVAFQSENDTIVSARSFGQVNVQIVMEKLGGGGNITSAGAQLRNTSLEEAEPRLLDAISEYLGEDDRKDKL
ncbi:MAG TPA: DHH family phosphoesterase [Candidatus Butyricicoccus avistercoris]|uniref:Cyclic-di-AMP phosphodiesterase n=1 Tax=Candidatus Butyricicoccus avistercoris TaxID=2838518 RepID=A0A9D1TH54_9FIRM|nr:DHH family phosphoesterase [Candidatus Butyricicoccus avistercoris]